MSSHPRTIGWVGTTALAMGGSNQSLFIIGALMASQGSAAVPLLIGGLLLSWAATPGWIELVLMWPNRVGGIAASCAEAFRPYSPVLANLTGVCYWWGWVPTCGLTAILSASALHQWYLPTIPVHLLASAIVMLFVGINLLGIRAATRLAIPIAGGSAILALLSTLVPVISGSVDWHRAASFHLTTPFHGVFGGITSAMAGLYLIGFAAPAFEAATCHVGETRDPTKNVKRAVYAAGGMASLYFVVIPIVWLGVLGSWPLEHDLTQALGPTFAPLLGGGAKAAAIWFMTLNMFHGTLQPLAGASRALSQLSEDGLLPRSFAKRSRRDVPWVATLLTAVVSIVFLQSGDPTWVIAAANLCYLIGIGMPSIAVWLLRRNEPDRERPYRAPRGTIVLGVGAALIWLLSTVLGFQQFGLPTVIASLALAYAGSVLYAWRVISDRRRSGKRGLSPSLHLKLTGAMIAVMLFDGAGYLLAVTNVHHHPALRTALEDIFVVVALLTITVGLVLPGIISHAVGEVAGAADRLANGTLSDLTRAMRALARGDLRAAKARKHDERLDIHTRDELGAMARNFNQMQDEVARAALALDDAREGLVTTETKLAAYAAEQTALAASERQAREELERANAAKSQFLSRVSHELRTPLNAILGFGQLLELDDLDARQRESLKQIIGGGRHLVEMINELLDISRIESGTLTLAPETVDISGHIAQAASLCATLAAEAGLEIETDLEAGPLWAHADEQRLKQVLLNLISNAVKYNRAEGSVRISARVREQHVVIEVTDTGMGIDPDEVELIFNPFERLGAQQRGIEGTGLGLSLSKALTEAMGGTISVRSQLGQGSTFAVQLVSASSGEDRGPGLHPVLAGHPSSGRETAADGTPLRGTVLYVEDNVANLRVVERIVVDHVKARFVPVSSGAAVLRAVHLSKPDVILLDLHLPDMHGSEVLAMLKADEGTRDVPVVVLSADATSSQIQRLNASGAVDYLTKPIELPKLKAVCESHLQAAA